MITVSDLAAEKMSAHNRPIRVLVKTTGCSGLGYFLEFADKINEEDHTFDSKGIQIVVDSKSFEYIDGSEIDYLKQGLNEGFQFVNPNEKAKCGCGESFTV